jgi:hypothetical protein
VRVWRKGVARPFVGVARWKEFVQTKKDGTPTSFWARMPYNQLAKCAEAQGLRKAFPRRFAQVFTADEMPSFVDEKEEAADHRPRAQQVADRIRANAASAAPAEPEAPTAEGDGNPEWGMSGAP